MSNSAVQVSIESSGLTDPGRVREKNEDHFVIAAVRKSIEVERSSLSDEVLANRFGTTGAHLYAVADGVGGRPGGERASELAVAALLDYLGHAAGCFQGLDADREDELLSKLEDTIRDVHARLLSEAAVEGDKVPATTLTLVLLVWPRAYLVHVGDSRAYARRRGKLERLTRDQTIGEYMLGVGAWTESQASRPGPAAALASAIGGSEIAPVVGLVDLEPGDALVLCTDGLSKHVPDDQIAAALAGRDDAATIGRRLVDQALEAGGTDNVTVLVVKTAAAS